MMWIEDMTNVSPLLQGGVALMIAGWLGYQLRALPGRAVDVGRTLLTRRIEVREGHPLYDAWLDMLTEGAVRPGGPRTLEVRLASSAEHAPLTSHYAAGSGAFLARCAGSWCRVSIHREQGTAGRGSLSERFIVLIEVLGVSSVRLGRMLDEASRRAGTDDSRQIVTLCGRYGETARFHIPRRRASTLCLPDGFFDSIVRRVEGFQNGRAEYERCGIPWRFGMLFHGEPGTGKTSIAHALASHLERPLAVIPLADLNTDEELVSCFDDVRTGSIVLIEDVDCAFVQRTGEDSGVSFSGFLNAIDGAVARQDGRVLVMSTNHIDRLDPALIRPGRVDLRIEVPLLDRTTASDYVDRLFAHVPTRHDIVNEVMQLPSPTPAMLMNRIMSEPWHRPASRLPGAPRARAEHEEEVSR